MKEKSIRWVFIKSYLIIISISLAIGFIVVEDVNKQHIKYKNYIQDMENTNRFTTFMDLTIEQMKSQSLEIVIDEELQSLLNKSALIDKKEIMPVLSKYLIRNTDLTSIYLIDRYNTVVCANNYEKSMGTSEDFLAQFNLSDIRRKQGGDYMGITILDSPTIYIARSIKSRETGDILGYLFLFVDATYLQDKMEDLLQRMSFEVIVVDENETVLEFPISSQLGSLYKKVKEGQVASSEKRKWENKYDHVQVWYNDLNSHIIGRYVGVRKDSTFQIILLGVSIINLLFFVMAIFMIGKRVIYPLERIADRANEITLKESLEIRFDEHQGYKEVSSIALGLNKMLDRIQFLMGEAQKRERLQKILELSVINHQVNPHFLYNTLNSVSVLISVEDKETAVQLVKSLARYYRACLNKEEELNTVEQEVEITKEYIHITLLKNPNLFDVDYDIEPSTYNCKMPRMIIQILAENAIKYGIRTMQEPLQIYIGVHNDKENERTVVELRDNGKGIDEETIRKIMKDEKLHSKSGFGLRSIIKRIGIMYNIEDVSQIINIETAIGHYTRIRIYIPWKSVNNDNNIQQ